MNYCLVVIQEDFEVALSRCLWSFSRREPSRVHRSPGRGSTWYVNVQMLPTLLRRTAVVDDEGSGFSFYFFFYSFAEYVDIDFLNYVMAPGSFHGAEGK